LPVWLSVPTYIKQNISKNIVAGVAERSHIYQTEYIKEWSSQWLAVPMPKISPSSEFSPAGQTVHLLHKGKLRNTEYLSL
jgi:hypothetical protein